MLNVLLNYHTNIFELIIILTKEMGTFHIIQIYCAYLIKIELLRILFITMHNNE